MDFETYILEVRFRLLSPLKDERAGQAHFNELAVVRPDLAERVRGTLLDPFYQDDRLPAFLDFVGDNW